MKNLTEELKNLDYKQAAIDHAEKAVFGLTCLLVLVSLIGTSWSRYEKEPEDFVQKVMTESNNLRRSAWPHEERAKYDAAEDIRSSVEQLLTKVDVTLYQYTIPNSVPLYRQNEKIKNPHMYAPEELIANSSVVILHLRSEQQQTRKARFHVESAKKKANELGNETDPTEPPNPNRPRGENSPRQLDGDRDVDIERPTFDEGDSGPDQGVGSNEQINAEGRRFVSIVGIVPLRKFALSYSKALNIDSPLAAADEVQFQSFELERQTATAGANPWTGKWNPVNLDIAKQILRIIEDYDPEVVSSALIDSVFTMPLPRRIAGEWDFWATHPRLKTLSKLQREAQMLIDEKALKKAQELQAATKKTTRHGGFAEFQHDIRGARRGVGAQAMQTLTDETMQQMAGRAGANARGLHAIIAGQVLLFRYLDFDVEKGNAYRYRLRLVLRNPNYNKPIEELIDPEIAEAELLKTPWSNTTNPVVVREYQEYYLTKVNRSRTQLSAVINILQWYQEAGTLIQTELSKILPGQFIAAYKAAGDDKRERGGVETNVLRPANPTLENERIEVVTKDVLLDIDDAEEMNASEHAELEIDFRKRGESTRADQVLVVDEFQQLKTLDSVNGSCGAKLSAERIERQNGPWLPIIKKNPRARTMPNRLDQLAGKMKTGTGGEGKTRSSRRSRRSNPLRK